MAESYQNYLDRQIDNRVIYKQIEEILREAIRQKKANIYYNYDLDMEEISLLLDRLK